MKRLAFLVIMALTLTACVGGSGGTTPAASLNTLRMSHNLWPGDYPVYIAQSEGYFAAAGLNVEATISENTDATLAGLAAGRFDVVAVSLGDVFVLNQSTGGIQVVVVADMSLGGDAFLMSPQLASPADLRGKRIGVNRGGFAGLFVREVLARYNLTFADVQIVDMDASELPGALQAGQVDAGHTWEPYITEAVNDGAQVVLTSADTPGLIPDVLAFRADVVRNQPDTVRGFVQAWFRAVDFWLANPAAGNNIIAQRLNISADEISLDGIQLLTAADNRALFVSGNSYESLNFTAQVYADFFLGSGYITTRPDINQLLNGEFIP